MASPQFNVVVDGSVLDGFETGAVLLQLQQQLKLPEAKAQLLVAGKAVTVKRDVEEPIAQAYCKRLRALGVNARVGETAAPVSDTTTAATKPAAPITPRPRKRYFSDAALTAANSSAFTRALLRANLALSGTVVGYSLLTLFGVGFFLFYLIGHAYLLTAPPVLFSATVYCIVSLALAIIAALLLRPVVPNRRDEADGTVLSPIQEPALCALVAQLCEKLALKAPEEIVLTTATGNTASLLPGFTNLKNGDYCLTISLPALENSSLTQFAALLAADLATQTPLPMLRYRWLKNLVSAQLDACLSHRDWLVQQIDNLADIAPPRFSRIFDVIEKIIEQVDPYLEKLRTRIARIDTKLQRPLLHEQDRYSASVAGSARFIELMVLRAHLETAARDANTKNFEDKIEASFVDDLPALIRHYFDGIEENFARDIQRQWNAQTTPRRDEPPIMRERIEAVAHSAAAGIIGDAQPASTLLQQRDELAHSITLDAYRNAEFEFDPAQLTPIDEITYAATQDILQRQQAAIYFNDWFKPFRFWSLADYKLISDMPLQDAAAQLSVCVNEIRRLTPDRAKLLAEYERLHNQLREILLAQHVLAAGKKFAFRYIHYDGTTLVPILEERQKDIAAVLEKLSQQEVVMGGRITLGLRLCGQAEREVHELHDTLRLMHDIGARIYKIELDCFQLDQLLQRQQLREADYALPIKKLETKIDDTCTLLMVRLNDIPYPFSNRYGSLKSFVEATTTQSTDKQLVPILQRAKRLLEVLYHVNEKLSRQAAEYGTTAEEAYRIEPIRLINGN